MADTRLVVLNGDGASAHIDIRTEGSNSDGRQVIVVGDPDTNGNVADVQNEDPGSSSTLQGLVVRLAGSARVHFAGGSTETGAVYLAGTAGTLGVRFTDEPTVIASGKQGTTTRALIANTDGAIKVYDLVNGTVVVSSITASSAIHILSTGGTMAVNVGKTDGTVTVRLDPGYELGSVKGINSSVSIHLLSTAGTIAVKIDPGYNVVNASHTIMIPVSVSSSASGVSASGNTVVAPVTSRVIKVYAFSLTTTAQVHLNARFTNGAGTGPTEFWRVALQAPSAGIAGANLAVTPPGYLWATAAGSTLSLLLDSASLVHYSVAYFLESA